MKRFEDAENMKKGELDSKILESLKRKLSGQVSEHTIQPAISRIRARYPFLSLNAAAEIFARRYHTSVQKYFNDKDREAYGTFNGMRVTKVNVQSVRHKKLTKPPKRRTSEMEKTTENWDVFICHASEDKD